MDAPIRVRSCSEQETEALGAKIASGLRVGSIVCVRGELGAGKSVLLRAVATALGVEGPIPSPSYNLVYEYVGIHPVLHVDLYRLSGEEEFALLGVEETMEHAITLVEWPERVPALAARASVSVTIAVESEAECRTITVQRADGEAE